MTYKEVAKLAGSPKAYRAVGNILNKNPNPKIIPCHRVIKSDGNVGGYKFGSQKKASLLKKERVVIKNKKIVLSQSIIGSKKGEKWLIN
ncbi:MAG: MGMT family protein [Candidatus Pacebacteria bacterium]|nr:MGMT family protein [Candidatus Paceibacterota bacterium]